MAHRNMRLARLGVDIVHLAVRYLEPFGIPSAVVRVHQMDRLCGFRARFAAVASAEDQVVFRHRMPTLADDAWRVSQSLRDERRASADGVDLCERHRRCAASDASWAVFVDTRSQAALAVPVPVVVRRATKARCAIAPHRIARGDARGMAEQTDGSR